MEEATTKSCQASNIDIQLLQPDAIREYSFVYHTFNVFVCHVVVYKTL